MHTLLLDMIHTLLSTRSVRFKHNTQVNKVLAMVKVHGMKPPQDSTSSAGSPATVYVGDLITYAVPEAYYYILLSFTASVISAVTLMPCMRSAKCYQHILDHPRIPQYKTYSLYALTRLLCHLNALVLPALCILFWLPPMTKDLIVVDNSLMSEAVFDSMRMYLVLVTVFLRVALVHEHIQVRDLSHMFLLTQHTQHNALNT